jgi:tetrahydromethanopterin S-methyltransferase subunit H
MIKSSGRVREKDNSEPVRKGWTMLMFDTPGYNGQDADTIDSFFFELSFQEFLREIRKDVNSFFGFPNGSPKHNAPDLAKYRQMWEQLKKEKEYEEHGRRIVFVRSTAFVW